MLSKANGSYKVRGAQEHLPLLLSEWFLMRRAFLTELPPCHASYQGQSQAVFARLSDGEELVRGSSLQSGPSFLWKDMCEDASTVDDRARDSFEGSAMGGLTSPRHQIQETIREHMVNKYSEQQTMSEIELSVEAPSGSFDTPHTMPPPDGDVATTAWRREVVAVYSRADKTWCVLVGGVLCREECCSQYRCHALPPRRRCLRCPLRMRSNACMQDCGRLDEHV